MEQENKNEQVTDQLQARNEDEGREKSGITGANTRQNEIQARPRAGGAALIVHARTHPPSRTSAHNPSICESPMPWAAM